MRPVKRRMWRLLQTRSLALVTVLSSAVCCGQVGEGRDPALGEQFPESTGGRGMGQTGGSLGSADGTGGRSEDEVNSSGGASDNILESPYAGSFGQGGAIGQGCETIPLQLLDPPCSNDDRIVPARCNDGNARSFRFLLDELKIPMSELQLALLPLDAVSGAPDETSGTEPRYELDVWLNPKSGGSVMGKDFVLSDPFVELYAQIFPQEAEMNGYLLSIPDPADSIRTYVVAHVVLVSGPSIIAEQRVIFEPLFDFCIY